MYKGNTQTFPIDTIERDVCSHYGIDPSTNTLRYAPVRKNGSLGTGVPSRSVRQNVTYELQCKVRLARSTTPRNATSTIATPRLIGNDPMLNPDDTTVGSPNFETSDILDSANENTVDDDHHTASPLPTSSPVIETVSTPKIVYHTTKCTGCVHSQAVCRGLPGKPCNLCLGKVGHIRCEHASADFYDAHPSNSRSEAMSTTKDADPEIHNTTITGVQNALKYTVRHVITLSILVRWRKFLVEFIASIL